MGVLFKSECVADVRTAAQLECAASFPRWINDGSVYQTCTANESGDQLTISSVDRDGTLSSQTVSGLYLYCDELADYTDVSQLFGLLLVGTLAVYLVKRFVFKVVANQ